MSVLASKGFTGPWMVAGERKVNLPHAIVPSRYFRWKPVLGYIVALMLLVPCLPIIALLVLLVRVSSPGPGIYRQVRVGRHGRTFTMYKIRTMRQDAEAASGPTWATANDPRLTRVGRVIRALHLDEFPQLFNVLRGEMSLIGPRPERPEFTQVLARDIPGYLERLAVYPGITGLAQINLPPDTDLDSVRRKLVLDLEYIREANLLLDARIMVWTLFRAVGRRGQGLSLWLGLQREVKLPVLEAAVPEPIRPPSTSTTTTNGVAANAPVATRTGSPIHVPRRASSQGELAAE